MIGAVMKQVLGVENVPSRYFDSFRVPAPLEDPCSILYLHMIVSQIRFVCKGTIFDAHMARVFGQKTYQTNSGFCVYTVLTGLYLDLSLEKSERAPHYVICSPCSLVTARKDQRQSRPDEILINPTSAGRNGAGTFGPIEIILAKGPFDHVNHVCRLEPQHLSCAGSQIPAVPQNASFSAYCGDLNFRRMAEKQSHQPRASRSPAATLDHVPVHAWFKEPHNP